MDTPTTWEEEDSAMAVLNVVVVCLMVSMVYGAYMPRRDNVDTPEEWKFLFERRFEAGRIDANFTVNFRQEFGPIKLLFYTERQYSNASFQQDCNKRVSVLQYTDNNYYPGQIQQFDPMMQNPMMSDRCKPNYYNPSEYTCRGSVTFNSRFATTWYIVASRCGNINGIQGLTFSYEIDMWQNQHQQQPYPMPYPFPHSGQVKVTYTALTLIPMFVLMKCLE